MRIFATTKWMNLTNLPGGKILKFNEGVNGFDAIEIDISH